MDFVPRQQRRVQYTLEITIQVALMGYNETVDSLDALNRSSDKQCTAPSVTREKYELLIRLGYRCCWRNGPLLDQVVAEWIHTNLGVDNCCLD